MKILIFAFIAFVVLLSFALCKVSATADRDAHEAYERWKERKKKHDRGNDKA